MRHVIVQITSVCTTWHERLISGCSHSSLRLTEQRTDNRRSSAGLVMCIFSIQHGFIIEETSSGDLINMSSYSSHCTPWKVCQPWWVNKLGDNGIGILFNGRMLDWRHGWCSCNSSNSSSIFQLICGIKVFLSNGSFVFYRALTYWIVKTPLWENYFLFIDFDDRKLWRKMCLQWDLNPRNPATWIKICRINNYIGAILE